AICDSLLKYWGNPKHSSLLATLLDPRLKKICPMSSRLRETAIRVCRQELDNITDTIPIQTASSNVTSTNQVNKLNLSKKYDAIINTIKEMPEFILKLVLSLLHTI
ncbi:13_t:CDS:2, partial [Cetraspora pellucida]